MQVVRGGCFLQRLLWKQLLGLFCQTSHQLLVVFVFQSFDLNQSCHKLEEEWTLSKSMEWF